MKLFCCQFDLAWEDKAANYAKVQRLFDSAFFPPGSLVALPEMFATGFSMNLAATVEGSPSATADLLAGVARGHNCYVVGGLVAPGEGRQGRNEAVVFDPQGTEQARYCKMRPFPLAGETEAHEAGQEIAVFTWGEARVAPFVCYDLRFPELFRRAVLSGAQVLVVIANWPAARIDHWTALLRARAIENQCYVAGVNRCGADPNFTYPGRSVLFDPHGAVVAEAGAEEEILTAEIDLAKLVEWRENFPVLAPLFEQGLVQG